MMRRLAIVWNPSKTDQDALSSGLQDARTGSEVLAGTTSPEVSWWETSEDDPGGDATRRAIAWDPDLIVVAGGDGTVRAVAEHLAGTDTPVELGIVPLGTGNLLARNLDIPLNDVPAAFARALTGQARPVDIGWVDVDLAAGHERHGFVVMVGFGIDAHMIDETNDDLKDKVGWLAYVESLGRALSASDIVPFHITADDQPTMMALTSWSRSPETMAAAIAQTIAANMTASTAHRQNDHSPTAALHNAVDVSKRIVSATANIAAVVPAAIPRPAFSNMPQTPSPRLQPNWMIPSLPPAA